MDDLHRCTLKGATYLFREPTIYDPAIVRRILTRQKVRRPMADEFRIAAVHGIARMGEAVGDVAEAERQAGLIEEWYKLSTATSEDDIDEPDFEQRSARLAELERTRKDRLIALLPEIKAIEANLERHWQAYADLQADRNYWDDISRIEIVRLMLVGVEGQPPYARDEEGLLTAAAYRSIPSAHRLDLATFAFELQAPDEATRKN